MDEEHLAEVMEDLVETEEDRRLYKWFLLVAVLLFACFVGITAGMFVGYMHRPGGVGACPGGVRGADVEEPPWPGNVTRAFNAKHNHLIRTCTSNQFTGSQA